MAVSLPILFLVYLDELFQKLCSSGFGCPVGTSFMGCLGYADDILLLSASRTGLQEMVHICEVYTRQKGLKFSTTKSDAEKSKCIIFIRITKIESV